MYFLHLCKTIVLLLLCIALLACSKITQANFDRINNNMTMQEVVRILGKPTQSESIMIGGISGMSAIWRDKNGEIDIQFLNDRVIVKSFSKQGEDKPQSNVS